MKKVIYILIGIFTFSVGFSIYQIRSIFIPIQIPSPVSSSSYCGISQHELKSPNPTDLLTDVPISLCEVSQHPELYQSKQLRMKAFLPNLIIKEIFFVSAYSKDCVSGATLEITEELKKNKIFQKLISDLRRKNNGEKGIYIVEIEIVGEINKTKNTENAGLIKPVPFEIKANEIKQISPIRFVSFQEIKDFYESK